ncbi:MAG: glycosyltransferase family 2 protein [Planctomycetes bacterium]|nr:glycosyltransferase family 2 protein [Planctomycetota bacterium]
MIQSYKNIQTAEPSTCDVSIVIVNWNARDYLRNCLNSILAECIDISYEIIVVDNASNDNSCEMLDAEFPSVQVIANSTNNGFAGANNQGIRIAKGRYVLLLNPDTIVLDKAIDKCIVFADERPEIGIVGCQVLDDEVSISNTCFLFPSPITILLTQLGFTRKFAKSRWLGCSEMGWWDRKDEREVEVVTGMFMLTRKSAIEKVGLMDEDYFIYAEEADWCYRFWKAGYKCVFTPTSRIIHIEGGGKSTAQIPERMFVQKQKSLLLFQKKNRGLLAWVATWLIFVGSQLIRMPILAAMYVFDKQGERGSDIRVRLTVAAVKYHLLRIEPKM